MSVTSNLRKLEVHRMVNIEAARIIAADPANYPPGSLPAIWAELILHDSQEGKR